MRLFILLLASSLSAQVPSQDSRNTDVPNTDTHFRLPVYKTRAEWEARAAKLRKQILFTAGLDPMPARNPLTPDIFGRIENNGYSIEKVLIQTLPGCVTPERPNRYPEPITADGFLVERLKEIKLL